MKNVCFITLVIIMMGCTSEYQPSDAMLQLKKDLTVEQATAELQAYLWADPENSPICATRGFWVDENATFTVFDDKFAMFAHQKGRQLHAEGVGFGSTTYYEKEYYRYHYKFSDISKIIVHKNFTLLNSYRACIRQDEAEQHFVIDFYTSDKKNLKFIITEQQFDKIMAAITTLMPAVPVRVNG